MNRNPVPARPWLHTDPALEAGHWRQGWTDVRGPDFAAPVASSAQATAVTELCRAVDLDNAAWAHQVHGGTVLQVDRPGLAGEADALWSIRPGLGVVGRSADCPLILIGGRQRHAGHVWGFAHASWRSTVQGITLQLVRQLSRLADPAGLTAVVCPSAGPCCYEVGPEVRRQAVAELGPEAGGFFQSLAGRLVFDLWAANRQQLIAGGVPADSVRSTSICTICGGDIWPSYRREGSAAGRFAAIIGRGEI